jgi:hypothetical protein
MGCCVIRQVVNAVLICTAMRKWSVRISLIFMKMTQENNWKDSDRKTYTVLRDQCCDTNVLNAHALTDNKSYDSKDGVHELEQVFSYLSTTEKFCFNLNAKWRRKGTFKLRTGTQSWHVNRNDKMLRVVNFVTSKNQIVRNTMCWQFNIQKCTWISPDHILIDVSQVQSE